MRYLSAFFICAVTAVVGVVLWLATTIPSGEGAFGIAKAVPFLFVKGSFIVFSVIWFPVNVGVFLRARRQSHVRQPDTVIALALSGFVFCFAGVSIESVSAPTRANLPPPPQRQLELKDVKDLIDGFCEKERNGAKLGPADEGFGTMAQLVYNSPPEIVNYIADNLHDNSEMLRVIAGAPSCTPRLFERVLLIPSTHTSLAMNPHVPPQVLEELSHSPSAEVRESVAANRNVPMPVLTRLAADSDPNVQKSAEISLKRDNARK